MLKDPDRLIAKLGEEAAELAIALKNRKKDRIVSEAADLVYHLLLALFERGVSFDAVKDEMARRRAAAAAAEGKRDR
jgi:phosphoribosyl-ATP pyrophosphohydrolase